MLTPGVAWIVSFRRPVAKVRALIFVRLVDEDVGGVSRRHIFQVVVAKATTGIETSIANGSVLYTMDFCGFSPYFNTSGHGASYCYENS